MQAGWANSSHKMQKQTRAEETRFFINAPKQFPSGLDHAVIVCHLELYEEGEVEHEIPMLDMYQTLLICENEPSEM